MELKRGVDDMKSFALFILVNIAVVTALSEPKDEVDQNLECTNDLDELMVCKFEAQNCPEYNLTLRSDSGHGEQHCNFQQCKGSSCCCSFQMILVHNETHTATVFKGGERMGSKVISIRDSVKPRVPTNVSVKESNGNFQVMWDTTYNMQRYFGSELTANVTYHKKGDTETAKSKHVTPTKINGQHSYEIFGGDLEPSTTYMVSVKSYTEWSRRYSDSSEEVEFTTSASTDATLLATIISLSLVAIIVSGAIYGCYVKFKTKWWDTAAKCPKPKLLDMRPREQEIFEPVLPVISSVCLEPLVPDDNQPGLTSLRDTSSGSPQQCSGISTGSSCFGEREPVNIIAGVQDALASHIISQQTTPRVRHRQECFVTLHINLMRVPVLKNREISGINRFRMELKRGVDDMKSFALFILVNIAMVTALSGPKDEVDQNLECTNDLDELMFCEFEAQNCPEYNLTLRSDSGHGEQHCNFQQCKGSSCCCSFQMILVFRETHTATVFKGGEMMGSKVISIGDSVKPRVPTNVSVKESNGNFQVMWDTTYNLQRYFGSELTANVTYHKKGDTETVSKHVTPTKINGQHSYEIFGGDLEPSTTYMVSVKSYTEWSRRYSDSSEEVEFTTPASTDATLLAIIISLSLVAIIISGAIYGCYVKFKTKWWDPVSKCPNPKLLDMRPREQELLKPVLPVISPVYVVPLDPLDPDQMWLKGTLRDTGYGSPQQSSGISTGSSCLSYANAEPVDIIAGVQEALGKAFASIRPISPLTINPLSELNKDSGLFSGTNNLCGIRSDDVNSGSSGIDNKSYSLLIPNFPDQITMDSSELQTQSKMLCDSAYHPSEGKEGEEIVVCPGQQVPACPLPNFPAVASSLMATDMSYQRCNADSGGFSYEEDSSLSSISSGTNTIASCDLVCIAEAWCDSSNEVAGGATKLSEITEEATVCDENPCYGRVPTASHSFPQVDDDYQSFQNLVEQPDMLLLEESW
ncbi:hypothetical protein D5F01_LYC03880 [Larimichthys crocea]|uniref:Fibronectin type-III domain-containing protein n=1 Tax=Larimichthys crocea TaxID=215358 RepID=A0A6G0J0Z8_LARCR|nr:hypothetical protein D5F01_LYC03880 [Larimichthys crocea]